MACDNSLGKMKRFLLLGSGSLLAVASIVLAQATGRATLRTPAGDKPIGFVQMNSVAYLSVPDVMTALGGTMQPDASGFKATLGNVSAVFGPDTRFAVVGEDLIEMAAAPVVINGVPFVSWEFFRGFLAKGSDQ